MDDVKKDTDKKEETSIVTAAIELVSSEPIALGVEDNKEK